MRSIFLAYIATQGLFFSIPSIAQNLDMELNCFQQVQEQSPGLTQDLNCVLEQARDFFIKLCTEDGVLATREFHRYVTLKDSYLEALNLANQWIQNNPEKSQLPLAMAANLSNAETAWMVGGRRNEYSDYIERIRRKTVSCPNVN